MNEDDTTATENMYQSDEVKHNMTTFSRSQTTFGIMLDSTEHPYLSPNPTSTTDISEAGAADVVGIGGRIIDLNEIMRFALPTACFVLRHESPHSIETITSLLWEIAVSMSKEVHEFVTDSNVSTRITTNHPVVNEWIPQVLEIMSKLTTCSGKMKNHHTKKKNKTKCSNVRRVNRNVNHCVYLELASRFRIRSSEYSDVCESGRIHRERCSVVQKGLIDLLSEVDPIKLLTKLKSAQVCRVCKTARYLIPRQDSVRSADEGARTFLDCYNPVHGGEIVVQIDG